MSASNKHSEHPEFAAIAVAFFSEERKNPDNKDIPSEEDVADSPVAVYFAYIAAAADNVDKFNKFIDQFLGEEKDQEERTNALVEEVLRGDPEEDQEEDLKKNHNELKRITEGTPFWSK